ncbi:MAG: substrate-binding domain-containing protein [Desulfovibrionaceae bacterium]
MRKLRASMMLLLALVLVGFAAQAPAEELMMATTTSTDNTGLLDYLAPHFAKDTGVTLKWTATGTGKALKLGETCDVDVLLVHAPAAEQKFLADGFGDTRVEVMYNDFVIAGPVADPAGAKGHDAVAGLKAIAAKGAVFVSRGDDSGTHKMEKGLWAKAGLAVPDKDPWYVSAGQGMLACLTLAAEKGGYVLTDRGTWITYEVGQGGKAPLAVLVEGDPLLFNQYSVLTLNKTKCPNVKHDLAKKFSDWMASKSTQKLIGDFKLQGKALFTPNAK